MLQSLSLKCANCGANLEIKPETETFACGYCGASQIVERHGGTVSLRLLTDAISMVQTGTDKTAAELAIRRIRDEMAEVDMKFRQTEAVINKELTSNSNAYLFGSIFVTIISWCRILSGEYSGITAIIWILVVVGIGTAWIINQDSIRKKNNPQLKSIIAEYKNLETKLEEKKKFVDS